MMSPSGHHLKISGSRAFPAVLAQLCAWAGSVPVPEVPRFRPCWLLKVGEGQAVVPSLDRPACSSSPPSPFSSPLLSGWDSRNALPRAGSSAAGSCLGTGVSQPHALLRWTYMGGRHGCQPPGHTPAQAAGRGRGQVKNNLYVLLEESTGLWLRDACGLPAGVGSSCWQPGAQLAQLEQTFSSWHIQLLDPAAMPCTSPRLTLVP